MAGNTLSLKKRRLLLEQRIQHERELIRDAADQWLEATAPIDRGVARLSAFKVPAMLAGGFIGLRLIRKPGKLVALGKRGLGLYTLARSVRKLLH